MSQRYVGLDLGASSVKAASVVRHDDGTFVVEHQASRALPLGALDDGHVDPDARVLVIERIRELFASEPFGTRDVIIGYNSSSSVFMDEVLLPAMSEEDYAAAIPTLLEAENPTWNAEDCEMAHTVVGQTLTAKGHRTRVLVFRVLSGYAREVAELVEEAGLTVVGADLTALATLRAIAVQPRPHRCVDVLIDIGANVTSLLVHANGVPTRLSLDPDIAGDVATRRVAEALDLDEGEEREAEWAKISDLDEAGIVGQVRNEYSNFLAHRISGILGTLTVPGEEPPVISGITLVGGGALLPGLGHHLVESLGIHDLSFAAVDPHIRVVDTDDAPVRVGGDYLAAIGLGTGQVL